MIDRCAESCGRLRKIIRDLFMENVLLFEERELLPSYKRNSTFDYSSDIVKQVEKLLPEQIFRCVRNRIGHPGHSAYVNGLHLTKPG